MSLLKRYRSTMVVQALEAGFNQYEFRRDRWSRRRRHQEFTCPPSTAAVQDLERDGFTVVRDVIDLDALARLSAQLDELCRAGRHLNRPANDSVRAPGDLAEASTFVSDENVALGEDHFRFVTNHVAVTEPFLYCPASIDLAFSDLLLRIAASYLRCPPAVGGVNLRKSFVNDLPAFDTLHFHSDPNSPRFLKFFFYLHDVDIDGGPFAYVRGSHREKFKGWRRKYRWTPEEIGSIYGEDRVVYATAAAGDLVIADTTGFHRGTKVRSRDRSMLTVNYVLHPEFRGRQAGFKIPACAVDRMSPPSHLLTDFLEIVRTT